MISPRYANDRGYFDHGWLQSYHTFSFGGYLDRNQMGYRSLRVINEDFIAGSQGFGMHGHENMEILTYIVAGELHHQDSVGNRKKIVRGEVQRMTAGSGIRHSEFNLQKNATTHLLQIWILPSELDLTPGYEQKNFDLALQSGNWVKLADPMGHDGALKIHQDCLVYAVRPPQGTSLRHELKSRRAAWLQVVSGEIQVESTVLRKGDGCSIEEVPQFKITSLAANGELLLFDLGVG